MSEEATEQHDQENFWDLMAAGGTVETTAGLSLDDLSSACMAKLDNSRTAAALSPIAAATRWADWLTQNCCLVHTRLVHTRLPAARVRVNALPLCCGCCCPGPHSSAPSLCLCLPCCICRVRSLALDCVRQLVQWPGLTEPANRSFLLSFLAALSKEVKDAKEATTVVAADGEGGEEGACARAL